MFRKTVATIISLLEALEGVSIEYDTDSDTDPDLLRAIKRLWDDLTFQNRLRASPKCAAIIREVFPFSYGFIHSDQNFCGFK